MHIIPHEYNLLIKIKPKEDSTSYVDEKSGRRILFPDKHRQITRIAEVKEIGEKVTLYKKGDIVLISAYSGKGLNIPAMRLDEDVFRIIVEHEILCHFKED